MPAIGLGTGGYGTTHGKYNAYPECWMDIAGCGPYTIEAVKSWLSIGGRRLDCADSYDTQLSVGTGIRESGVARKDIFILQKIGNTNPMGYNDTLQQSASILEAMGVTYVDLMLNHWPTSPATYTSDATCNPDIPTYDAKQCRLNTWRALVEVWQKGQALSIGVANYNSTHLQEIIDAGMPLPSVNQVPFHIYNAAAQSDIHTWCKAHNITLLSYSPMGIPDWHAFPTGPGKLPVAQAINDPVLLAVAAKHAPATPGQVVIAWLWAQGLPCNPRTMNVTHMADNLAAISAVTLDADDLAQLSSRPIDYCSIDPTFYECVPTPGSPAPASPFTAAAAVAAAQ